MSGDKVKTKLDRSGEVKAFSQTAMANNHAVVDYCNLVGRPLGEHGRRAWPAHPLRVRFLRHICPGALVDDAVEGGSKLEEILCQPPAVAHQRLFRPDVHLRALLDLPVRNGARLLVCK